MSMKNKNANSDYLAPDIEVVLMLAEAGFAQTNLEDPLEKDPQDW